MTTYGYSRLYILVGKNTDLVLSFEQLICDTSYSFIRPNGNPLPAQPLGTTGGKYLKGNIQICAKSKVEQDSDISGFLY